MRVWRNGHLAHTYYTAGGCANCYKACRRQSGHTIQIPKKKEKKVKQNAPKRLFIQIMLYSYNSILCSLNVMILFFFFKFKTFMMGAC